MAQINLQTGLPTKVVEKSEESRKSKVESRKTSDAQMKANQKWQATQSRMTFRMSPELREQVDSHATQMGESTTAFIIRAIKEQMERDKVAKVDLNSLLDT